MAGEAQVFMRIRYKHMAKWNGLNGKIWQDGSSENEGVMLAEWLSHLEKQVVPKMLRQWEQLDMREQIVHQKTLSIHWICSELNVEFTARHSNGGFDLTGTLGCIGQILLGGPNSFMGTTVWKFCNWDPRHNHNVQPLITRRSSRRHFKFISCFYVLELRWCQIKLVTCTDILLQTTDLDGYLQGQSVFFPHISQNCFFSGNRNPGTHLHIWREREGTWIGCL